MMNAMLSLISSLGEKSSHLSVKMFCCWLTRSCILFKRSIEGLRDDTACTGLLGLMGGPRGGPGGGCGPMNGIGIGIGICIGICGATIYTDGTGGGGMYGGG